MKWFYNVVKKMSLREVNWHNENFLRFRNQREAARQERKLPMEEGRENCYFKTEMTVTASLSMAFMPAKTVLG